MAASTAPNPALVSERAAARLPRLPLVLLCAAYVLPGLFGRDPWKNADLAAFGYIRNIASGQVPWQSPTVGGLPGEGAHLPYWIGSLFVRAGDGWLDPAIAARIPFALLLVATLAFVWHATYHFGRAESAQPLPFAFGGEASVADYARAIADGGLLALIASLGLLQLGHETTPELAQLAAVAGLLCAVASTPRRPWAGPIGTALALPALAASGAPSVALLLAVVTGLAVVAAQSQRAAGLAVAARRAVTNGATGSTTTSRDATALRRGVRRRLLVATAVGGGLAVAAGLGLDAWANRLGDWRDTLHAWSLVKNVVWFAWPAWLLALWTIWRWRTRLLGPHLAMPLGCTIALLLVWLAMAGADRALLLALPPLAILAAFALPTLQRSAAAAIDWFSVFLFSIAAAAAWVYYVAIQTGQPAGLARNVAKLSVGYVPRFSWLALAVAVLGTLAWIALVRWRTRRTRHPLWKSLVLPAGGVALVWLLVMTLLLPPLDNARSYRSQMARIGRLVPPGSCVAAPAATRAQAAALEYHGGYVVDAVTPAARTACPWLLLPSRANARPGPDWLRIGRERRMRNDDDTVDVYRRIAS